MMKDRGLFIKITLEKRSGYLNYLRSSAHSHTIELFINNRSFLYQMDVQKHVQAAVAWLASEHNFFIELKNDLANLKEDLESAKAKEQVKDIKKAFRDFRYLARSEQRFQQYEKQVEEALADLGKQKITVSGTISEIHHLIQRLQTEAASLIHDSSFYEGKIQKLLTYLQVNIQEHHLEQAQAVLMEIILVVDDAEKWIAALSVDLNQARQILLKSQEEPDPNWDDFENPETQRQIQRLLVQRLFKNISIDHIQDHREIIIKAYFGKFGSIFWIRQNINTKRIDIGFPAPTELGWDQSQFSLQFYMERERKRGKTFRVFLEKLLEIIADGTKPHGR